MPHINLLPWREELRQRRQKEFAVMAGIAVMAMAGVVAAVHLYFVNKIEFQQQRNTYIEGQIAQLDKKIEAIKGLEEEKQRLLARMEIIQQLQASRPEVVHLFDELVRTLPEGIYFNKVAQDGRNLAIEGMAQSNARVSSLMRNLDASAWLENPALVEIRAQNKGSNDFSRLSKFTLRINQTKRGKHDEEKSS